VSLHVVGIVDLLVREGGLAVLVDRLLEEFALRLEEFPVFPQHLLLQLHRRLPQQGRSHDRWVILLLITFNSRHINIR